MYTNSGDYWRRSSRSSTKRYRSSHSSQDENVVDICCICYSKVSWLERLEFMDEVYHSKCFKCNNCKRKLHLGQFVDHHCKPYCHACYHKEFEMKNMGLLSPKIRKSSKILIDTADPLQAIKHTKSNSKSSTNLNNNGKLNIKAFCEKHNIPTQNKSRTKKPRQRQSKDIKNRVNKYRKSVMRYMNDSDPEVMSSEFDSDLLANPQNYSDTMSHSDDSGIISNGNIEKRNKMSESELDDLKIYLSVYIQEKFNVLKESMNNQISNMQQDMMQKIDHKFDLL